MFLQELVDEMKIFGIEADYRIAHGVASRKIAAICERDNVSLIMMTKTGADMTNGDDLGSTSENVVLNSDCAVCCCRLKTVMRRIPSPKLPQKNFLMIL